MAWLPVVIACVLFALFIFWFTQPDHRWVLGTRPLREAVADAVELAALEESGHVLRPERAVDEAVLEAQRLLVELRRSAAALGRPREDANAVVLAAAERGPGSFDASAVTERILSVRGSPGKWVRRDYEVKVIPPSPGEGPLARAR
jgi:hypothetical protein